MCPGNDKHGSVREAALTSKVALEELKAAMLRLEYAYSGSGGGSSESEKARLQQEELTRRAEADLAQQALEEAIARQLD
ncbi:hypothetical protein N7499_003302 [Penicillium canescens]|uniref:Uncharacterized protein n=1 Tax=Penicillium canescens TaxID=5083 RepID=A0AAD6I5D3_PENCN|nr:uncharacterized protein N7446_014072 [Penicillium canescens]KAJ6018504.1 hypothetical protein N7522_001968 [Penicillium canescens]KAJ6034111.1 hypothetical protein N7460_009928 [Penicillium canescens]KAJ6039324.1 hypothetical protein N7446_014072 [Penicillium canescens]KAJ6066162.1 hypothetical protein N7444_000291 [Penicillium canescens]KAJ6091151.1 hypothetical protein N7499_003302 [Penicillium canescens]